MPMKWTADKYTDKWGKRWTDYVSQAAGLDRETRYVVQKTQNPDGKDFIWLVWVIWSDDCYIGKDWIGSGFRTLAEAKEAATLDYTAKLKAQVS